MLKLNICVVLAVALAINSFASADGFHDDFSNPKLSIRQALRGDWQYSAGVARCKSDPELYKQFKNHGPILRWPAEFTNGTIEFEFKPNQCQRLVFTLNEDGHVFRISLSDEQRTRIFGWIGKSSKENKPETIIKKGVPNISSLEDKWVKSKLAFDGNKATVVIGDFNAQLDHESIGRKKGEFTISFAFGDCEIKNVRLTTND